VVTFSASDPRAEDRPLLPSYDVHPTPLGPVLIDLGFFDHESIRVECAPNPFEAKVLYVSGIKRYPCDQNGP